MNRLGALLGSLACLVGCANTAWTIPEPFAPPGSNLVYLKTRKQTQSVTRSWKDWSVHTVIDETRYRAIDLRTCAKVGDYTFPGATHELAWDGQAKDLWLALDSAPDSARSLRGRAVTLPPGLSLPALRENDLPSTRISRKSASGVVWLWRAHAGSIEIIARDTPPIEAVVSVATRTVAVMRPESGKDVELLIVDEVVGGGYSVSRRRLPAKGSAALSATLLRGGAAIAFLSPEGLAIFDLASGQRSGGYALSPGSSPSWSSSSPHVLAVATYDRDINQAGCSARISLVDAERGGAAAPASAFSACFASLSWIGGSQVLVAATQSAAGARLRWLLDVASGWWISAPDHAENWQGFGQTVVFDDGPAGSRHLSTVGPPLTAVEPVTVGLGDVRFVTSEPVTRTTVVTAAPDELFLYRVDSRRLEHCANR